MKEKLNKLLKRLIARIPEKLPTGIAEFNFWSAEIIDIYEFPDNDSIKFALATMIMHSDSSLGYASKHYFMLRLVKGMANQVAAQIFQDIKTKQQEQLKDAQKLAEAPAKEQAVSLVSPLQ